MDCCSAVCHQAAFVNVCRDNPGERLGNQIGGVNDIKSNRYKNHFERLPAIFPFCSWFEDFDWEGLHRKAVPPPFIPTVRFHTHNYQ